MDTNVALPIYQYTNNITPFFRIQYNCDGPNLPHSAGCTTNKMSF